MTTASKAIAASSLALALPCASASASAPLPIMAASGQESAAIERWAQPSQPGLGAVSFIDSGDAASTPANLGQSLIASPDLLPDPLPANQAFVLSHAVEDSNGTAVFHWEIAEGYYLYHHRFAVRSAGQDVAITVNGDAKTMHDEFFGDVEVYYNTVDVIVAQDSLAGSPVEVHWQGCSGIHQICYPPDSRRVRLEGIGGGGDWSWSSPDSYFSQAQEGPGGALLVIFLMFLGGIALSFTPCVLPMIPILTGVLGAQTGGAHPASPRRLFLLGLVYVGAMALCYAALGIAVGLTGQAFAAQIQRPVVLIASATLIALMALWLMGLLRLPMAGGLSSIVQRWQSRLPGGSVLTAALAGCFASLIVSPCISPPLVAALVFVSQTGDWLFGGLALLALGLGMGVLVLAVCLGAAPLLPRAGAWMQSVNLWLGVGLLMVALWLLRSLLPASASEIALALALLAVASSEGALDFLRERSTRLARIYHGFLLLALSVALGLLLIHLVGPAQRATARPAAAAPAIVSPSAGPSGFRAIDSLEGLRDALAQAPGKPAMLDVYADWCVSCHQLERHTFTHPEARAQLARLELLRLDVSNFNDAHQGLFRQLGLFGPPALLFFDAKGDEMRARRLIGFVNGPALASHIDKTLASSTRTAQAP